MAKLICVSGVGDKSPACFVLEAAGKRIMFDLGEGPEPGVFPDLSQVANCDALILSHAHIDHIGALHLSEQIGSPIVYATELTFSAIPLSVLPQARRRLLPLQGQCDIAGISAYTGRSGHAPGGIWIYLNICKGFIYTGDWSAESNLLPYDLPPLASILITDASYGDRDQPLSKQFESIANAAHNGAILSVPPLGRGPELAIAFWKKQIPIHLGSDLCQEIRMLLRAEGVISHEAQKILHQILANQPEIDAPYHENEIIITTDANAESGHSAELLQELGDKARFIFTGHVPDNTPAQRLLAEKKALWLPWNVHPRCSDIIEQVKATKAKIVVPAFVNFSNAPQMLSLLGDIACRATEIELKE